MRWKNKGHEYDEVYGRIVEKKGFWLFGCGDYGRQFLQSFQGEVPVIGYIDNNPEKQKEPINGKTCMGLDQVSLNADEGIILIRFQCFPFPDIKLLRKRVEIQAMSALQITGGAW